MQSNHAGSRRAHTIPGAPPTSSSRPVANPTPRYPPDIASASQQHPVRSHSRQESVGSIVDDPFFHQRFSVVDPHPDDSDDSDGSSVYQSLPSDDGLGDDQDEHIGVATRNLPPALERDRDDNTPSRHWPPPRRESLTAPPSSYWVSLFAPAHTDPSTVWAFGGRGARKGFSSSEYESVRHV